MMKEQSEYRQFTMPAELHKAINTLRGIVAGISTDSTVSRDEINELTHWCSIHSHLRNRHPFSEIIPVVEAACADGSISEDEAKDILWVCSSFADSGAYYDVVTSSIQFLSGLIHGIMADGELSDKEIQSLQSWINTNDFLAGSYPFDEINALLYSVMEDKQIDTDERNTLLAFLSNLVEFKDSLNLVEQDYTDLRQQYSVSGVCTVCPDIQIEGRTFCFTGESYRSTRKEIAAVVDSLGGTMRNSVTGKTDYLVVGNAGNPCWAYACYGRKIEEAVSLRKSGGHILIVNETDFWDVVEDALAGIS